MDWVFFLFMLFLGSMMDNLELKLHILLFCLFITEEKTWHSSSPLHPTMSFRTHFKLRTEGFNQSAEHTHASAPVAMNENIWLCYYAYWNRKKKPKMNESALWAGCLSEIQLSWSSCEMSLLAQIWSCKSRS